MNSTKQTNTKLGRNLLKDGGRNGGGKREAAKEAGQSQVHRASGEGSPPRPPRLTGEPSQDYLDRVLRNISVGSCRTTRAGPPSGGPVRSTFPSQKKVVNFMATTTFEMDRYTSFIEPLSQY